MNTKIWLSSPHMGGTEQKYIKEAFENNWVAPLGPNVNEFEKGLKNYLGTNNKVVALSSGTAALHLALILAGVTQNDVVLCQSFTFSASANPICYQGALPVFIDSEPETWNICPLLLEKAIKEQLSKGNKPKAVVVVHLFGMPAKMKEIKQLTQKYNMVLIEDAASALGSKINGQSCGTFGDFGILSFNGNKIITTSGGGALICKEETAKQKAIFLATQARDNAPHYQHSEIGYNYRMSNIVAGIGRGQLEVLADRVAARRSNFEFYKVAFSGISAIQLLEEPQGYCANRWLTCIVTSSFEMREKIRLTLEKENIEARPLWKPMHQQPVFKKYSAYINGVSDDLFERGLCLPSGSNLNNKDLHKIVTTIKDLF
ncbi:aminotransferase class I/II-fold pyridoxal phosphate-dependent enzyme [Lutibacter sp. HS1-25]|uniref:aminotransferase class I/II-fold pyridoxal phosphate-dependent enzyme n=1 Tax=Lutibacter sp. HS1-25 TaxID=2485000 RepID=UPI001010DD57|nr:aminotransferase class I/II-fold pyridoxal phosphate-dependent enzyme [Lutibacter sp. HS1-25]RXP52386.1 aminotransferase class I/II-fold pyridoxal phosphate-dependent enzyme [Lutibacter sp. HS1-25]